MQPSSEIPRPAGSFLAHSLRFVRDTMQFYEDAFRECGDIFTTRVAGLGHWVYVCSPALVHAVLAAPPDVLAGGGSEGFSLSHLLGKGATSHLHGAAHQERRDVAAPYLGVQASLRHAADFRRITQARIAEWPLATPFRLVPPLQRIALESLLRVIFRAADEGRIRELADAYERFSFRGLRSWAAPHAALQVDLGPRSPWGRVKQLQREVVTLFSRAIDERLAALDQPAEDDLLLGLARARFPAGVGGGAVPREALLAEVLDLLFQGHELTGDSLAWTVGEVIAHPEVLARLRQELAAAAGEEEPAAAHLARMPYLEATVYEGLRRRPSNFFTSLRRVCQPFALGGYLLPVGTLIAVCYPALGSRQDLYADPQRFAPDRFLGQGPPADACPFGGGSRVCAGRHLAVVIMKMALATIVRHAELGLAQDGVRPVRNAYYYEPDNGQLVTLEKRL